MNSKVLIRGLSASVLGLALGGLSPAHAGDYELWREQVQITASEGIKPSESGRRATASDYTLWREQVNSAATEGLPLHVATSRSGRHSTVPDYLFWREQVKASEKEGSRKWAASK